MLLCFSVLWEATVNLQINKAKEAQSQRNKPRKSPVVPGSAPVCREPEHHRKDLPPVPRARQTEQAEMSTGWFYKRSNDPAPHTTKVLRDQCSWANKPRLTKSSSQLIWAESNSVVSKGGFTWEIAAKQVKLCTVCICHLSLGTPLRSIFHFNSQGMSDLFQGTTVGFCSTGPSREMSGGRFSSGASSSLS